jgi:hypothetical protein
MVDLSILEGLNQSYFSPFMIFIKGAAKLADSELLSLLNLNEYNRVEISNENQSGKDSIGYMFIANSDEWVCIMDDWNYALWCNEENREKLLDASNEYDIFYCSVGDSDDSYDFAYFKTGEVIREYVVEDPSFKGGKVVKDIGIPLPIESQALLHKENSEKVITIAKSFGIKFHLPKDEVRIYYTSIPPMEFSDPF